MVHVKQEPPLLPGLDPPPSFGQEARTAPRRQPQVRAAGHAMTQRLQVGPQVKVGREEEGQAVLLERHMDSDVVEERHSGVLLLWLHFLLKNTLSRLVESLSLL